MGCSDGLSEANNEAPAIEFGNLESNLTASEWPSQVIVATNSIEVGSGTHISGSVVAKNSATGSVLSSNAEVVLAYNARVSGDVWADTLVLNGNVQVPGEPNDQVDGEARYNTKTGIGTSAFTLSPLALPVSVSLPSLPNITPGTIDVSVGASQTRTLGTGTYRNLSTASGNGGVPTKLILTGGTYVFSAATLGNDTRVECVAACDVRVKNRFKLGARSYWGPQSASLASDKLLLSVAGTNGSSNLKSTPHAAYVENDSEVRAFVLARNGTFRLGHRGKFMGRLVAKDVWFETDINAEVKRTEMSWVDAPIRLDATNEYDPNSALDENGDPVDSRPVVASKPSADSSTTPVSFTIPDHLPVTSGNAGNGEATFSFTNTSGQTVVCTYRGGASVAHPTEELDQMKGRWYLFESCNGGQQAGEAHLGTKFATQVLSGDSGTPWGETSVGMSIGDGCHDVIEPQILPADVVALKQGFHWDKLDKLEEVDPEGNIAVWHGLIYIERKEQLAALDRFRVMWSATPLSPVQRQAYAGKCGRVEHAADEKGVVVYAIFPAKFFNLMQDFALQAAEANIEPPFRFIVPSPLDVPGAVNADGSLRHEALAQVRYHLWLAQNATGQPAFWDDTWDWVSTAATAGWDVISNLEVDVPDAIETPFNYANSGWDTFVDFTGNLLDDAYELIQQGIQEITLVFVDSVRVRLNIRVRERDPQIGLRHLSRMWGAADPSGARPLLVPRGARVRIRQPWPVPLGNLLPAMGEDVIDPFGNVNIRAIKGLLGNGDSDICVELDSEAASMSTDIIPNEMCFFGPFHDYSSSVDANLEIDHRDVYALTQFTDARTYSQLVIGHDPSLNQVLIGWGANSMTSLLSGGRRAMALCLDFPGMGSAAINSALLLAGSIGTQTGGVGPATAGGALFGSPLYMKDVWLPDGSSRDSRGVATHEYGHFEMCSILFDQEGADSLTGLITRTWDGEDTRDDDIGLMTETWADEFALQITGGFNYMDLDEARGSAGSMNYCIGSPCADVNRNGAFDHPYRFDDKDISSERSWLDENARWSTLVRDAFDSSNGRFGSLAPGNGDYWIDPNPTGCAPPVANPTGSTNFECHTPGCVRTDKRIHIAGNALPPPNFALCATPLQPAVNGFIANDDEPVALPGSAWTEWIARFLDRSDEPNPDTFPFEYAPTSDAMIGALADVMVAHSNWCDACEVVAMHSPVVSANARMSLDPQQGAGNSGPRTFALRHERFQACQADDELRGFVGAPPREDLHIDTECNACQPLEFARLSTGQCTPCPTGSVPLPFGQTVPDPALGAPGTDGQCLICPNGTVPSSSNTCIGCQPEEIVVNGVCTACPLGHTASADQTQCVACSVDVTVDWTPIDELLCKQVSVVDFVSPPGDTCPDQLVSQVSNILDEPSGVFVGASVGNGDCPSTEVEVAAFDPAALQTSMVGAGPTSGSECPDDLACLQCLSIDGTVSPAQLSGAGAQLRVVARVTGPETNAARTFVRSVNKGGAGCEF